SRRRHTRSKRDWSSDVCSSDLSSTAVGAKVLSSPTITPLAPTAVDDWEPEETAEGWREVSASAAATDAIDSWATALTSSPADLRSEERRVGRKGRDGEGARGVT